MYTSYCTVIENNNMNIIYDNNIVYQVLDTTRYHRGKVYTSKYDRYAGIGAILGHQIRRACHFMNIISVLISSYLCYTNNVINVQSLIIYIQLYIIAN